MNSLQLSESKQSMLLDLISGSFAGKNPAPHCANPDCPNYHHKNPYDTSWRKDHSTYETKAFGTVKRYRCTHCGKTFSDQTFVIDYYVKQTMDYLELIKFLVTTSGQGNITRFTGKRYELIQNRFQRLSRAFLALNAELRQQILPHEDFVLDGFETFTRSQFFPCHVNLITGADSEFIYGVSFSQLRRKGKMTEAQKRKRAYLEETLGKAPPKAIQHSVERLCKDFVQFLTGKEPGKKTLFTDEHKAYARAFKNVEGFDSCLKHSQHSSKVFRNYQNKLFSANYTDRQIRKDQANHVRETVQFARCPAAMMARISIYIIYHNYIMPRRVKQQRKRNWETRGEYLGLNREVIRSLFEKVLGRRVFFHKCELWEEEKKTWNMEWRNEGIVMGKYVPLHIAA